MASLSRVGGGPALGGSRTRANAEGATRARYVRAGTATAILLRCMQRLPSGLGARRVRTPPGPRRARRSSSSKACLPACDDVECAHQHAPLAHTLGGYWDHQHPRSTSICGPAPLLSTLSPPGRFHDGQPWRASPSTRHSARPARCLRAACAPSCAAHCRRRCADGPQQCHHRQRARGPDPSPRTA
jgi:hypothetical protein